MDVYKRVDVRVARARRDEDEEIVRIVRMPCVPGARSRGLLARQERRGESAYARARLTATCIGTSRSAWMYLPILVGTCVSPARLYRIPRRAVRDRILGSPRARERVRD